MRWMDLESVIRREVGQRENRYHMLTHIYEILKKKKKNGYEEPRGRTGIEMQMWRVDLRTWGGRGGLRPSEGVAWTCVYCQM